MYIWVLVAKTVFFAQEILFYQTIKWGAKNCESCRTNLVNVFMEEKLLGFSAVMCNINAFDEVKLTSILLHILKKPKKKQQKNKNK